MGLVFARGVRRGEQVLAGKGESRRVLALLRQRPQFWPAVRAPDDRRKLKLGRACGITVVVMIGQPIAFGGFHRLRPARPDKAARRRQQQGASALQHRFAVLVSVWALDPVGAADANVVGRGDALAALIEADEEGELAVALEDGRGLDRASVCAAEVTCCQVDSDMALSLTSSGSIVLRQGSFNVPVQKQSLPRPLGRCFSVAPIDPLNAP